MLRIGKSSASLGLYDSGDDKYNCVHFSCPLEAFRLAGAVPVQSGIEAAAENNAWKLGKTKGEKIKLSYLFFLQYLQEKTQPDAKYGKTRELLHLCLVFCVEFSCLLLKVPSTARGS